ncbi:MAG: hypothetical protein GXP63_06070 [DPANN group archaeon]|nr:hypothetical protein [DPANN group archaeon]
MIKHDETRYLLVVVGFALLAMAVIVEPSLLDAHIDDQNIGGYASVQPPQRQLPKERTQEHIVGDIDGNGRIDSHDLEVMGLKPYPLQDPTRSDLNRDGQVDDQDRSLLQDYLDGKVSRLPAVKGDVDGDLAFTSRDVEIIAAYVDGQISLSPDEFYAADINADGTVDEADKSEAVTLLESLKKRNR